MAMHIIFLHTVRLWIQVNYPIENTLPIPRLDAEWLKYAFVKHANISLDNALSPVRRQAIIWTYVAILSIRP